MFDHLHSFGGMCGRTAVMETLYRHIQRVARTDVSVLVTGESGTGKELVARALHVNSARRDRPFIALNCSALSAQLVESELFGHLRGAFTGAVSDHAGLFQAAHGGTLFLDEIGDLALATQAKVLRALENGEVMSVGSTKVTRVDVRVVAATNKHLETMVVAGAFREDLLYRLKVVRLPVPTLRERKDDIALLAEHFLREQQKVDGVVRRLSADALQLLIAYSWPGNVRELRNALAAAAIVAEDSTVISAADLYPNLGPPKANTESAIRHIDVQQTMSRPPDSGWTSASITSAGEAQSHGTHLPLAHFTSLSPTALLLPFAEARANALQEFDRYFLAAALDRNAGNVARTARELGLHRQSLQKLMTRRGLKAKRAYIAHTMQCRTHHLTFPKHQQR